MASKKKTDKDNCSSYEKHEEEEERLARDCLEVNPKWRRKRRRKRRPEKYCHKEKSKVIPVTLQEAHEASGQQH